MISVPGFQMGDRIYESPGGLVCRAVRELDGAPVIIKATAADRVEPEQTQKLRREYELLRAVRSEGVIAVHSLEESSHGPALVMEDIRGRSLDMYCRTDPLTLTVFNDLAVLIARAVADIHAVDIIHKDINPSNIIYNPDTGQIKLIDFGSAVTISDSDSPDRPVSVDGTPAYMSPEQTGRINVRPDWRTDFYSLGATLYELLTGRRPFEATDPLELVHHHIAIIPVPPHQIRLEVPEILSDIVMKLLAKNPDDRYQSAWGIKTDFEECRRRFEASGAIEPFDLGRSDIPERFHFTDKLYGRSSDLATLMQSFDAVRQGKQRLLLVTGPAGAGKSALVREVYEPITRLGALFVSGKYDPLQRSVPYSAMIEAFRALVRHLLAAPEAELQAWSRKLETAVEPNAKVITDVLPEAALIVGPQPDVPELGPVEAQNRFNFVMKNFVRVFCRAEHPLVLFLDDLQWADTASLKLLEYLLEEEDNRFLMIIGAYRDTEVDETHPLRAVVRTAAERGVPLELITLNNLDFEHVTELVSDTIKRPATSATPLAELILSKTAGNPFFVHEFLKSLYDDKLLEFDHARQSWQWDLERIKSRGITDNVVELVSDRIRKMSHDGLEMLKTAAALGNRFDVHTLAVGCGKTVPETAAILEEAVLSGLLVTAGRRAQLNGRSSIASDGGDSCVEYKFSHDRIQQAAYGLIPDPDKARFHWRIGSMLSDGGPLDTRSDRLFDILSQLNLGVSHDVPRDRKQELAALNLSAGKRAKSAAAFDTAYEHLLAGVDLLDEHSWKDSYILSLEIHLEAAEAAYLCTEFARMEELTGKVFENALTVLDKVRAYEVLIQAHIARNRMTDAVNIALTVLDLLGVRLPPSRSKTRAFYELLAVKWFLILTPPEKLLTLPEMTNPRALAAMRIISSVAKAAFVADTTLVPFLIFKSVELSVKYGNAPESSFAYATYGMILCGGLGDIQGGYRFGETALKLSENLTAGRLRARTLMLVNFFIRHWKDKQRDTLAPLLDVYRAGLETGNLEDAALSAYAYCVGLMRTGCNLSEVAEEMSVYCREIRKLRQDSSFRLLSIFRQAVLNQIRRADPPWVLNGDAFDEETMLPILRSEHDHSSTCALYANKLFLAFLFGEHEQAVKFTESAEKHIEGVRGTPAVPGIHFIGSLARLSLAKASEKARRTELLKKIRHSLHNLKKWAGHCPHNFLQKYVLAEAELMQVRGRFNHAAELYDEAIELARAHEYINDEAMAHELAAKFYLAGGKHSIAKAYLTDARDCYAKWGAAAKVEALEHVFKGLIYPVAVHARQTDFDPGTSLSLLSSGLDEDLDINTVIRTSQAISEEIHLRGLLDRLLTVVLSNAGARDGFLLTKSSDGWIIEAYKAMGSRGATAFPKTSAEKSDNLATSIVNYVGRTGQSVVLGNACHEGGFSTDPYIQAARARSVMCVPLKHKGEPTAMLYLENNLTANAFTPKRLELVEVLASQAGISLENARLYERLEDYSRTLEQRVSERTLSLLEANVSLKKEIDRKERVERELHKAKERAEQANRAKSEFLANMSHELRTPLNAVIGLSEILQDETYGELNTNQQEYVAIILESGTHLLRLINDILDLAKVEAGKMELELNELRVAELIRECLHLIKEKAASRQIKLQHHISDDVNKLIIRADMVKLKQILFNLLSNAAKFTPMGGHIRVDASRNGSDLVVGVSDTGIGINAQDYEKIFKEFEQVDASLSRRQQGTGLGLALTRRLVELHGGRIRVESEGIGKGSSFTFTIPLSIVDE